MSCGDKENLERCSGLSEEQNRVCVNGVHPRARHVSARSWRILITRTHASNAGGLMVVGRRHISRACIFCRRCLADSAGPPSLGPLLIRTIGKREPLGPADTSPERIGARAASHTSVAFPDGCMEWIGMARRCRGRGAAGPALPRRTHGHMGAPARRGPRGGGSAPAWPSPRRGAGMRERDGEQRNVVVAAAVSAAHVKPPCPWPRGTTGSFGSPPGS